MKFRLTSKRGKKAGLPPGTLMYVGDRQPQKTIIHAIAFDEASFSEIETSSAAEALTLHGKAKFLWINVDGLQDIEAIRIIGEHFKLHALALEDVLNAEQRPKAECFDDFLLIVLKSLTRIKERKEFEAEQVSIFLGRDYVISFQEKVGDVFEPVRQRLKGTTSRLRKLGPDFLFYTLIDTVVDNYFLVLEDFGERIEALEHTLVSQPDPKKLTELYAMKRAGLYLRRCVWPLREALTTLERGEGEVFKHATMPFLRDVYSHLVEIIDTVETFREMLSSMLDIYLSSVSNKMNTVIKVLTIITTIFMPLSLIAGIYGMNFTHMPEISWEYGYPLALGLMLVVAVGMLAAFRWKKWI